MISTRGAPLSAGVWGVLATPFVADASAVDTDSLARLARHLEAAGVQGIVALGVFGEASVLAASERLEVLRVVRDVTEVPIVAGTSLLGTSAVIEELTSLRDGIGDRLVAGMVQINSPHVDETRQHYHDVHHDTELGLVVQDYPASSGVTFPANGLGKLLDGMSGLAGFKAESPPTVVGIREAVGTTAVFGGLGGRGLVDELHAGAAGAMTGFSFPEGLVATVDAWEQRGYGAALSALRPYLHLINFEQQPDIALAIRKQCMVERGLIDHATVRPPSKPMPTALRAPLRNALAHLDQAA